MPVEPSTTPVRDVFLTFLKLGLTAFGGPVAHLGYFQAVFVEQKRWLTPQAYAELVALCQFIPGPASSQVGFAIGLQRAGISGAIAAWAAFTLPSALLMLFLGISLVALELTAYQGLLQGLKVTAVAVVCWALWSMARSLTPDYRRRLIALLAAAVALLLPGVFGQLGALLLGALLSLVLINPVTQTQDDGQGLQINLSSRLAGLSAALFIAGLVLLPSLALLSQTPLLTLSDAMYRAGSLVFGGGHVVLPLLHAETVNQGLINADDFLAGYGAAQAMPGPLFSFSAFIGAQSGVLAAAIALVSIFLPGCLLLIAVLPVWQTLRHQRRLRQTLSGVNAAVVGLLAAALYDPVITAGIHQWQDALLALVLLGLLATGRIPVWLLVPLGGLAGYALL
ncbi:Chromate transport protein ChrA [Nitrincola lacisaponensis]|uniref:Chromate transport protein ChrA n=1 Tax=Nitrincola lacisaponensis TaxID=267850 RepID=A0A063XXB7_9GAMM|nr:chromate efflux transporter [Nitrincola lacisaponensis]KDE38833.1 Chromate transport protein ChrA [Nitrincola lacisaponensis]